MFFTSVHVRSHERGLCFRRGEFYRLLEPGTHRFARRPFSRGGDRVAVVSTLATRFGHELLDGMLRHAHVRDSLHVVDLTDVERALVWKDERLAYVLGPGRHAFWKVPARLFVETFRVDRGDGRFAHPRLPVVLGHADAGKFFDVVPVESGGEAVLYRDGVLVDRLAAGLHVYWKGAGRLAWTAVDVRERATEVCPCDVAACDGRPLRVNLLVCWRVSDPALALAAVCDVDRALAAAARAALRAAAGRFGAGAIHADAAPFAEDVRERLAARAAEFGVAVRGVDVAELGLPHATVVRSPRGRVSRSRELDGLADGLRTLVSSAATREPA